MRAVLFLSSSFFLPPNQKHFTLIMKRTKKIIISHREKIKTHTQAKNMLFHTHTNTTFTSLWDYDDDDDDGWLRFGVGHIKHFFFRFSSLTFSNSNRNGLAAHKTILWAGKLRPPAANVQSTKSLWHRNNWTADTNDVP